jgi:fatty-acyl-CoA synthase
MSCPPTDPRAPETIAAAGPMVGEMIVTALHRYPGRVAFVSGGRTVTYTELAHAIGRAQAWLDRLDLPEGAAVIQFSRNCVEQFVLMAACYLGGYRSVTLQSGLHPVDVQARQVARCLPGIVVADVAHADRVRAIAARLDHAPRLVWVDAGDPGGYAWETGADGPWPEHRAVPETVVRIGFTSGTTTGEPKGVLLSSRALGALTLANLADGDWPADPCVLCTEAIAGGFGNMIMPTLVRGGRFIVAEGGAEAWFDAVERWRPNAAFLMPWSVRQVVDHPRAAGADLSGLKLIGYSGAVLPDAVMDRALALFGPVLSQIYGQTEFPKALAVLTQADHRDGDRQRLRSLGQAYSGTSLALFDDAGDPVAPGAVGELCARGPAVFSGYLADPDRTGAAWRDGWYRTGDLCRCDGHGYLHFVDRRDDRIAVPAGWLLPGAIERDLRAVPAVRDAAVLGAAGAVAVLLAGGDGDQAVASAAVATLRRHGYHGPVRIAWVPAVPWSIIGRLDRRAVRALWEEADVQGTLAIAAVDGL